MLQHTRKPNAIHPDPRKPLPSCIKTNGGESDVHPYEKRSFNMAELAALNGFPAWHKFPPTLRLTALRELIGNAVPALSFQPFFDKVVKALKQTDEENEEYEKTEGREYV
jgi:DNA (cytosine-5)-methyltransferase 1